MRTTLKRRQALRRRRTSPPVTALGLFLLVGAGVAAIAQPIEPRERNAPIGAIRIVLPPSSALAPSGTHVSTGTLRIMLSEVGPRAPVPLPPLPTVAPPASALAASAIDAPGLTSLSGRVTLAPTPAPTFGEPEEAAELAQASGGQAAGFSAAMEEITASLSAASTPGARPKPRASAARIDDPSVLSGASRPQPLVTTTADNRDPVSASDRAQMILTDAMTPRKRSMASVTLRVSALVNGASLGRVGLLINDGENISAQLADLLAVLKPEIDAALYERLSSSRAAQGYMTLNELRAAGIRVRFDDKDRLVITTR
jgi:hypothetical protein